MNLEGKTKEEIIETLQTSKKQERAEEIKATQATTRVKLPSNGLINPSITEVTLKRMTTMQSKTLFTNNDPNFLTTLVMSCIVEPVNIKTTDLHPNDIVYLLFILRYISSPKEVVQRTVCMNRNCRHEYNVPIKIQDMSVNYAELENINTVCTLPDSGDVIQFKILSEGELNECDKISDRKIRQNNIEYSEQDWTRAINKVAYMIQLVNDKDFKTFDEKLKYLENLSAYDFEYFNNEYSNIINSFGIEREIISSCPRCGYTNEVEAYISPEFFRLV